MAHATVCTAAASAWAEAEDALALGPVNRQWLSEQLHAANHSAAAGNADHKLVTQRVPQQFQARNLPQAVSVPRASTDRAEAAATSSPFCALSFPWYLTQHKVLVLQPTFSSLPSWVSWSACCATAPTYCGTRGLCRRCTLSWKLRTSSPASLGVRPPPWGPIGPRPGMLTDWVVRALTRWVQVNLAPAAT